MPEVVSRLSDSDKDEIILQAIQVCRWAGWMLLRKAAEVEKLKKLIEDKSGFSIMEYT